MKRALATMTLTTLLLSTLACTPADVPESSEPAGIPVLDTVAESYVKAVLALGELDQGYVDAYYGPSAWREEAKAAGRSREEIRTEAEALLSTLAEVDLEGAEEMVVLRHRYLTRQLEALVARTQMLGGERWSFDDEAKALYDVDPPHYSPEHFEEILAELDRAVAEEGFTEGTLAERLAAFRAGFIIPDDKVDAVFRAAIEACRERTLEHLELPEGENFTVEYVYDKPWNGYNWYHGEYQSLIQVNLSLPVFMDRAIDLACHEGYPGHHVYNSLLEKHLVDERGWVELSVYPLHSPQSLIAEGSANYGIEMAFPGPERARFESEELFPLAGLDPERAAAYYRIEEIASGLSYAGNEAARAYLDGEIDAEAAVDYLVSYGAMSPERAKHRVRFMEAYRSYFVNYNVGLDLVRRYVEDQAGDDPEKRWEVFGELLSSPRLPSGLAGD